MEKHCSTRNYGEPLGNRQGLKGCGVVRVHQVTHNKPLGEVCAWWYDGSLVVRKTKGCRVHKEIAHAEDLSPRGFG